MLTPHDFVTVPGLVQNWQCVVETACLKASAARLTPISVKGTTLKNKITYKITDLSDELLVRKTAQNLKRVTHVKQQNRDAIVSNLTRLLAEGVSYRIYRLDIRDFFGSIDTNTVLSILQKEKHLSRPTRELITNILGQFNKATQAGLPRGLELSSVLAEYTLSSIDNNIRRSEEVFFYSRFVDDIAIVTCGNELETDFLSGISDELKSLGLTLNTTPSKLFFQKVPTTYREQNEKKQAIRKKLITFNFLGYQFNVFNPGKRNAEREIEIDISPDKVKKIKTKLIKAFLDFIQNRDFGLLSDRLKLLTGNYYVRDKRKFAKRTAGIFYSYRHANAEHHGCAADSLDRFFRHTLLSEKGKISSKLATLLTKPQKRALLKNSFFNGYKNKTFHHFNPVRLGQIMECWKYV